MDINQPFKGMNMDTFPGNLDGSKAYTFALNARQESEDGNEFNITNESTNTLAVDNFPVGFKVIGRLNIVDLGMTIYWLTNPDTGACEIGYVSNNPDGCIDTLNLTNPADTGLPVYSEPSELSTIPCMVYTTIVSDSCMGFSVVHPIHDARYKITNKTTEVYWTDNFNPPRWMDINNPPLTSTGGLDCNLLSIFPDYGTPSITVVEVQDTGSLKVGAYQFLVAYASSIGVPWSQYYAVTEPTPVWEDKEAETLSFDTSKSIKIRLDGLDTEYSYINIAVIKTINFTQTFELAATLSFNSGTLEFTYTGDDKTAPPMTRDEIYYRAPYYRTAGTLETQNRILMMGNLVTEERVNYQPLASAIKLYWQTYRIPYNKFEAYNNGANTANLRGYMRDEVYPFDMVIIERSGRVSDRFPFVGRVPLPSDLDVISNADADSTEQNPCDAPGIKRRWQVYNTASNLGFLGVTGDNCYIGPWEYGEFGYWESERLYPDNPLIWGSLANSPIRHFKFPDSTVTHIHDNNPGNDIGYEHAIYPIGVMLDKNQVLQAIAQSPLTQAQKDNIAAIRILRGNRRTNKSIQAKGLIFNVGSYKFQDQEFLYPNYPFNDTNPDVFLSNEATDSITGQYTSAAAPYSGLAVGARLNGFTGPDQLRYTFISPDTSFIHPSLSGQLKLETVEFGKANGHIVHVQTNPRYEIGTQKGVKMAVVLALTTVISIKFEVDISVPPSINSGVDISFAAFLPAFLQAYDMINKLIPFEQYGFQYNAVGNYCNYFPVPNNGDKIRQMTSVGYAGPGMETIPGEVATLNNFQRESSVYVRTSGSFQYPWSIGAPRDNSRFTFGSYQAEFGTQLAEGQRVIRDVSAYYASLKRYVPDQYGDIHSYTSLDTGTTLFLDQAFPTIFGGDTFINRFAIKRKLPFFISNTIGAKDNTDVDYSLLGNVSYPTFYLSTGPIDPRIRNSTLALFNTAYNLLTSTIGVILAIATGGVIAYGIVLIAMFTLMGDIISTLGIKKVNLDRFHDAGFFLQGVMYLFAYGIPYYFVESDFNCDYRQAVNGLEGNFFPRVGTDIPDYWLQEKNVSITEDNMFTYNRDLSKQNIEDLYTFLPEDWDPTNNSFIHTTRVIYSQPYSIEERTSNWLSYGANDYYDFAYNNGPLIALKAVEQDKILAMFENNTAVYNAFITLQTNVKSAISNPGGMFSTPPQEFSRTDIGYSGTQHHAFCSTPFGHFWVDARRGTVFNMSQGIKEISKQGMTNWFKENLPFKILRTFPDYPVDNNYNGMGIAMVWDNRFNRLIITKRDYVPIMQPAPMPTPSACCPPDSDWKGTVVPGSPMGIKCIRATEFGPVSMDPSPCPGTGIMGTPTCCPQGYTYAQIGFPNRPVYMCVNIIGTTVEPFLCESTEGSEILHDNGGLYTEVIVPDITVSDTSHICCPDGHIYNTIKTVCCPKCGDCECNKDNSTEPIDCPPTIYSGTTNKTYVNLNDPKYFCDASWTIAYSPITDSWISFYSFIPNFYTEQQEWFQSGVQDGHDPTLWNHLLTNKSYQTFYNDFYNFEIEPITKPGLTSDIITAVNYRNDVYRYENQYDYRFMKDITFTQSIISSTTQTSGLLEMHVQRKNNLYDGVFATQNLSSISIPVANLDNLWRLSKFSDVTKDANSLVPILVGTCSSISKELNDVALDYSKPFNMFKRQRLKSDWFKVRLINNLHARYKFVFKWLGDKVTQLVR